MISDSSEFLSCVSDSYYKISNRFSSEKRNLSCQAHLILIKHCCKVINSAVAMDREWCVKETCFPNSVASRNLTLGFTGLALKGY